MCSFFFFLFFGVCPTFKLLRNVSEGRDRENNEERMQNCSGSALGPVS